MGVSWMKTGSESAAAAAQEQADAEIRKQQQGKMFRFFMGKGEEGVKITFVDGSLDKNGFLLPPRFYEHMINTGSGWENFICPEQSAPEMKDKCPLCESGDRPSLISIFTVIDHRTFTSKDGTKTYTDSPKLFTPKSGSMEILNKIAAKRGGLAGCTFDVFRTGDKAPSVGSAFDFCEKGDPDEMAKLAKYQRTYKDSSGKDFTDTVFKPADYEKELIYRTGDELRKLGFGKPSTTGSSPMGSGTTSGSDVTAHL